MSDWSDGYITNTEYTSNFYPFLSPGSQNLALLLSGCLPVELSEGYTYCELGCGQGYSTAVLAAANPTGRFWGVDFNPTHIAGARKIKAAGGLDNLEYLEKSFGELADTTDLPAFDFIALHGVWSWINADNRAAIAAFLYARLKPGGVVCISYNALPGWSGTAPLRQLMVESQRHKPEIDAGAVQQAVALAKRMKDLDAGYFKANPVAGLNLDSLLKSPMNYLIHEYFNRDWQPSYFSEVAADLRPAKLAFACSSDIVELFDQLCLTADALKLLQEQSDPITRETIRDFFRNTRFRRDLFTRGARKLQPAERAQMLNDLPMALVGQKPAFPLQITVPIGGLTLGPDPGARIVDLLAEGPKTIAQLMTDPALGAQGQPMVFQVLLMLAARGLVQAALPGPVDCHPAQRFNRAMLSQTVAAEAQTLASPVLGNGVTVPKVDQMILAMMQDGVPPGPAAFMDHATRAGLQLNRAGPDGPVAITSLVDVQMLLDEFATRRLPQYRSLKVV